MDTNTRNLAKTTLFANLYEWYEFSIYGFLANIIAQLFFESGHPTLALIQTFSIFAVSYFARPLGGLVFGSLADRIGRGHTLKLSLILMSVPTFLIGMLPTYSQIGWVAPVCLLVLRLIQGFGAGGELTVIGCYIYEASPPQHRGILCSCVNTSGNIGILCGSFIFTLLTWTFSPEAIHAWAWRIPFLLGIPLTFYIFYVRKKLIEFQPISNTNSPLEGEKPILTLLTHYKAQLLQFILLTAFPMVSAYILAVWMPTYLVYFAGYSQKIASLTNTLTLFAMGLFYLASGWLSDRIGYKRIMVWSIGISFFSIYPLFVGLQLSSYWLVLGIQLLFALYLSGGEPLLIRCMGDHFPRNIRASGVAVSYTIAVALFGGTAPFICTWLTHKTGLLTFPALYIMFFALLALPVALRLKTGTKKMVAKDASRYPIYS